MLLKCSCNKIWSCDIRNVTDVIASFNGPRSTEENKSGRIINCVYLGTTSTKLMLKVGRELVSLYQQISFASMLSPSGPSGL